ncbi:MAG: hypothetical protein HYT12_00790 [Candidatus Liptonbacteria bacterium]|nr:hypothetical protein [Candidatus Liptonbacteria bacterium]
MSERPREGKQNSEDFAKKESLPQKIVEKRISIFDSLKKSKLIRPLVLALALTAGGGPLIGRAQKEFLHSQERSARTEYWRKSGENLRERVEKMIIKAQQKENEENEEIEKDFELREQKMVQIREIFGDHAFLGYRAKEGREGVAVGNFKFQYAGGEIQISAEHMREAVMAGFPRRWAGEIKTIAQVGEIKKANVQYGLRGDWNTLATTTKNLIAEEDITFYKDSESNPRDFFYILSHEIGHANDWGSDNEMNFSERFDLLLAMRERLRSEDRHISDYVENIKNEDKQKELYLKASEYWAEICAAYFSDPANLNYKDFALVDAKVKKYDPEFDGKKWHQAKANLGAEMQNQSRIKQIKNSINEKEYEVY